MKNNLTKLMAVAGVLAAMVHAAGAATYRDYDPINIDLDGAGAKVQGIFNVVTLDGNSPLDVAGFNPATETIVSASAAFALWSDDTAPERVNIDLGVNDFFTTPGTQVYGTQIFGGNLTLQMVASLQVNGSISYTLTLVDIAGITTEDVGVKWANLYVTTKPKNVDDNGMTLGLLALSLVGLVGWRRAKCS